MGKRRENATDKLGRSLLGGAMASGLAAASLYGVGPANATCVGISGINIGDGCESTFGNFSIGLGPDTQAHSNGFLTGAIAVGDGTIADTVGILTAAWAGGTGSAAAAEGIIAWAVAQGDGDVVALAGDAPVDIANFAFNFGNATDGAESFVGAGDGAVNLAANLGGNANAGSATGLPVNMEIFAGERLLELRDQCHRQPEHYFRRRRLPQQRHLRWAVYLGTRTAAITTSFRGFDWQPERGIYRPASPHYRSMRRGPCGNTVDAVRARWESLAPLAWSTGRSTKTGRVSPSTPR